MIDIRVSFQGGGVYLAQMLPIAHAFQTLHENGVINVESVSGTSAGSICAALLANRSDFDSVRTFCKDNLEKEAKILAKRYYNGLRWYKKPWLLWKVLRGKDILSRADLELFVAKLIKAGSHHEVNNVQDFHNSSTRANLFIARSSLKPLYLDVAFEGKTTSAIVDSCSIPFAFRGHKTLSETSFIDGGMCENLPVSFFQSGQNTPVFGVSIVGNGTEYFKPKSALDYLFQLFSMSVGYSVERSKKHIGESFLFQETAPFGFADIRRAVEWYLNDEQYENVKQIYIKKLQAFAEYRALAKSGSVYLEGLSTLEKRDADLRCISQMLYRENDWNRISSDFILTAHSANPAQQGNDSATDTIQNVSIIKSLKDHPKAYKTYALFEGDRLHPTTWSVFNKTKGRPLSFQVVHYQDPQDGGANRDPCLILFENSENEIYKNDKIEIRMVRPNLPGKNMRGLASKLKRDFIIVDNRHAHSGELRVILKYPAVLGRVSAVERSKNTISYTELTEKQLLDYNSECSVELKAVGVRSNGKVDGVGCIAIDFVAET